MPRLPISSTTALLAATTFCLGLGCTAETDYEDNRAAAYEAMEVIEDTEPVALTSLAPELLPPSDDPNSCTLEVRPAVVVGVFQTEGDTLRPITQEPVVLYRHWSNVDGWGPIEEATCADDSCTMATLGHGEPGTYVVGAFGCGDGVLTSVTVEETADGCHVDTVYAPMVLDEVEPMCLAAQDEVYIGQQTAADENKFPTPANPSDTILSGEGCELSATSPSIVATTGVREGDMILPWTPGRIVSQFQSEQEADDMGCLNAECTMAIDGWGQTGTFEVTAEVCGTIMHETVEVPPTADGCDAQTQWVNFIVPADECVAEGYAPA